MWIPIVRRAALAVVATAVTVGVSLLIGCGPGDTEQAAPSPGGLDARAAALTRDAVLVDTHVDVPYRLFGQGDERDDVAARTNDGHFDAVRARAGGLDAPFMSIYVPASKEGDGAREHADRLIDLVETIAAQAPETFEIAMSADDVERIVAAGKIALPMGMENGAPLEGDLDNLRHFHARGIRYITLTHSENNHISDSSYSTERRWNGLSPFGEDVVREMNRLGIMVDVSHLSDAAFDRVLDVTTVPVIASHSSCRHFTPGFERNLDDDRIRRLAAGGGVIQINFGSAFVTAEANRWSTALWTAMGAWLKDHDLEWDAPEAKEHMREYVAANPEPKVTVADVADHIDHVVELVGADHVGIGSDFDGVTSVPEGLADVSQYPNLVAELIRRGYTDGDIRKILGGNLLRVWRAVEVGASDRDG